MDLPLSRSSLGVKAHGLPRSEFPRSSIHKLGSIVVKKTSVRRLLKQRQIECSARGDAESSFRRVGQDYRGAEQDASRIGDREGGATSADQSSFSITRDSVLNPSNENQFANDGNPQDTSAGLPVGNKRWHQNKQLDGAFQGVPPIGTAKAPFPGEGNGAARGSPVLGMPAPQAGRSSVPGSHGSAVQDSEWINSMDPEWYPVQPLWQGSEQCLLADKQLLGSLPPLWRVMLLSDGSVTRHLELITGHPVTVDCLEMKEIGHALLGTPPSTALVPGPRVQRQVHLKDNNGDVLIYAASWWASEEVKQALTAVQQPVWVTLTEQKAELYRCLQRVYYGHAPALERTFGKPGPYWARHYIFYRHGRPLTLIYEVFSSRLNTLLGDGTLSL